MNEETRLLTMMVRGAYDLQALRMQAGLRLCANFRAKLKTPITGSKPEDGSEPSGVSNPETSSDKLTDEAEKVLDLLKASYKRLTDGVARNRSLPKEKGFVGDELISRFSELTLVDQYIRLESQEVLAFRQMTATLEKIPIYVKYLEKQRGIGPAMAGVLISTLDPSKARHVSSFWKYAGLDVGSDGRGRSRRAEHLVKRAYTDKNGKESERDSITYNPWLKTKLFTLAGSFMRSGSPWREAYDGRKHRVTTDPGREKVTLVEWKKRREKGDDVAKLWAPGRVDMDAKRYMLKMFLLDLWVKWREIEGLPVTLSYHEGKLGYKHKAA